jgi:transcription antitermination factor NusG
MTASLPSTDRAQWYALRVRSRREKAVATALRLKGYEDFLPVYIRRRCWANRIANIETPLFPNYVFCRVDLGDRRALIASTPGVLQIVGNGLKAVAIEDHEIAVIRHLHTGRAEAEPWPYMPVGRRVSIVKGPLAGIEGILVESKTRNRVVVSVHLLQQSVAVEIDGLCVVAELETE